MEFLLKSFPFLTCPIHHIAKIETQTSVKDSFNSVFMIDMLHDVIVAIPTPPYVQDRVCAFLHLERLSNHSLNGPSTWDHPHTVGLPELLENIPRL